MTMTRAVLEATARPTNETVTPDALARAREVRTPRRPLKVMHVVPRLWRGGMEHNVVKLTNATDRTRIVSVICSCLPADNLKHLLNHDVPLFEFARKEGNDPGIVRDIARLFRRERPDIVHTHAWGALCEGFIAAKLARVPVLIHGEHGTMKLRPANRLVQRVLWNRVDRLLSVSSTLAATMSEKIGVDEKRIHVIHNGVDVARFRSGDRRLLRDQLQLTPDDLLVVTVGRLEPVKDHAALIAAAAEVRCPARFKLALVGEGMLRESLEAEVRRSGLDGIVHFLGHRHDIENVLAAADLFVLSSRSEGLPNGVMEAMAAGVPVVSTAVGGATELVVHGITGLLVPPRSSQALGEAITTLLCDPSTRLAFGENGRRRAIEHFAFDRMVEQYETLYLTAARESKRLAALFEH
jgi:L-malate glycosyltransferase